MFTRAERMRMSHLGKSFQTFISQILSQGIQTQWPNAVRDSTLLLNKPFDNFPEPGPLEAIYSFDFTSIFIFEFIISIYTIELDIYKFYF